MSGVELRKMGTTATFAPVCKRGLVTLTDGRVASVVIDTNLASSNATDTTGVAKMYIYLSTNASRTAFTVALTSTPAVAPASSTRYGVYSVTAGTDNKLWVAWQGTDNALYVSTFTYNSGPATFTASTVHTVVAAGAITNRFRALDIDISGTGAVIVGAYEASAATGSGAQHSIYALKTDLTTWIKVFNQTALATGQFIRDGSEDISVAWRGDGIVSNVGHMVYIATKAYTTADLGDTFRQLSMNISTMTASSATTVGTWGTNLNLNNATGTRRYMLFTLTSTIWSLAAVRGNSVPMFHATKATSGSFGSLTFTYTGYVSTVALSNYFKIDPSANNRTMISFQYRDNKLSFGFCSIGAGAAPRITREIVYSYTAVANVSTKPTVDAVPRPMDANQYFQGGPLAIYAGDNKRLSDGLKSWNFLTMYGPVGNAVGQTDSNGPLYRRMRFVAEDTFDGPFLLSPFETTEPTDRPIYRVRVINSNLTPNLYGKIEIQAATDSGFTTNIRSIIEDDSKFQYFGTKDGLIASQIQVSVPTLTLAQALFTGTWFFRARIVSDKDTPGAWSGSTYDFFVSHPPVAKQTFPLPNTVVSTQGTASATLVTNGDMNGNVTGWSGLNGTLTYSTVQFHGAPGAARLVPNGSSADNQVILGTNITIDPTQIYTVGAWVRPDTVNKPLKIQINWYDVSNVFINSSFVQVAAGSAGVWQYLEITADPSLVPGAVKMSPAIGPTSTPAAGDAVYIDDISVVTSPSVSFSWSFTDTEPLDTQSAYNVIVKRTDTNVVLIDTGFVTSANHSARLAMPSVNWELPLTWTIQVKDSDAAAGPVAAPTAFVVGGIPIGAIVTPANLSVVTTAMPTVTWTFTGSGSRTQKSYRVSIIDASGGPLNGVTVADTLWLTGTQTSYTFPTNVVVSASTYNIKLEVLDSAGLYDSDQVQVTTLWTPPLLGNISVVLDTFKATISWTDVNKDTDFVSWRVYRRYMVPASAELDINSTRFNWVLIYETLDDITSYSYLDYTVPLNKSVQYVVVQVADRFGSLIESTIGAFTTVTMDSDRYYFVPQVPVGTIASFEASAVVGDQFTREIEQETLHVVGRGRQMQVGDDLGYSGTLTIHLRNPATARLNREFLEAISADNNSVYLKSPFGDVVLIGLGNIGTNRLAGFGGNADISDLSVPYFQIIDADPVIRLGS